MKRVYKYPLRATDVFTIDMPVGAEVLSVQEQDGSPMLWALVDPNRPVESRTFRQAGTGHSIDEVELGRFVGTFQLPAHGLVFHLWEAK